MRFYIEDWSWHNENLSFFFQSKENSLHVFERPLSSKSIWLYFTKFHFRTETFDAYPKDHKFSIWLWIIQSSDEKCRHSPIFHWEWMDDCFHQACSCLKLPSGGTKLDTSWIIPVLQKSIVPKPLDIFPPALYEDWTVHHVQSNCCCLSEVTCSLLKWSSVVDWWDAFHSPEQPGGYSC